MIDYLVTEYDKLVHERTKGDSIFNLPQVIKGLPIKGRILLLILFVTGVLSVILFELYWFTKTKNNYGIYLFYSTLAFVSTFYSIYRYSVDYFEEKVYENSQRFKNEILEQFKQVLIRYELFSFNKLSVLIAQCDSKIAEAQKPLKPLSAFIQVFFIPLLIASFQPFFTDKGTAIKNSLSVAAMGMAFYGFLYLLAPVKNVFESGNVNRLERLKKELQSIQIVYFN